MSIKTFAEEIKEFAIMYDHNYGRLYPDILIEFIDNFMPGLGF